jgi:hypothetical protein
VVTEAGLHWHGMSQGRSTVGKERFVPLAVDDIGSEEESGAELAGPEIFQVCVCVCVCVLKLKGGENSCGLACGQEEVELRFTSRLNEI